ncbi:MAG: hypothetical protein PCFJNLEI_03716 [Verrucomicrobiae bacterium]|nr:hypothetical protein [Verrucomicrobiae bacterium]
MESSGALTGFRRREVQEDARALVDSALDFNLTVMVFHDRARNGQAQAGTFGFGGEVRVEDALPDFVGHAGAGIGDGDGDAFGRAVFQEHINLCVSGGGVNGVAEDGEEGLLEESPVNDGAGQVIIGPVINSEAFFGDLWFKQCNGIVDDGFDLVGGGGGIERGESGVEGAHPLIEFIDEGNDVVEADARIGVGGGGITFVLGEGANGVEQTADVVGDVGAGFADSGEVLVAFAGRAQGDEFGGELVDVIDDLDKFLVANRRNLAFQIAAGEGADALVQIAQRHEAPPADEPDEHDEQEDAVEHDDDETDRDPAMDFHQPVRSRVSRAPVERAKLFERRRGLAGGQAVPGGADELAFRLGAGEAFEVIEPGDVFRAALRCQPVSLDGVGDLADLKMMVVGFRQNCGEMAHHDDGHNFHHQQKGRR